MQILKEKTVIITGASQGIGLAIALRFAEDKANIVVATKDTEAQREEVKKLIEAKGSKALVLNVDVSNVEEIQSAIDETIAQFGALDVLVNNTSATCFNDCLHTTAQQFDLVISTSVRATFFMAQTCLPYLKNAENPHIVNISPPLHFDAEWFKDHMAFSIAKYAMSLCTLGMAKDFQKFKIAVNSLWPETTIATQTIKDHFSSKVYSASRWPSIMANAAYELVSRSSKMCSGNFFTDEMILREAGVLDFSTYAVDPNVPLMQALFIPKDQARTAVTKDLFLKKST